MSPLILDYAGSSWNSKKKRRTFAVAPAKVQDVRRLVDIEFHAFEDERVNQVLSYRDHKKAAHFERSVRIYETDLNGDDASDRLLDSISSNYFNNGFDEPQCGSRVSYRKIVEIETDEIISFTKFEFKEYTKEELDSPPDHGHEGEAKMNRDWFALNERLRREYIGLTEHCYIAMLATEPRHQHNGAGTMLLEEILAEADDAGLEVYLEATDTAKPLYEKHGFEAITELRFDPAEYGIKGLGRERQTVMVRGALGPNGERKEVRPWETAAAQAKADLHQ